MIFNKIKNTFFLLLFLLMPVALLYGQNPIIKASIDSVSIMVGQQTKIHLEIIKPGDKNVTFPLFHAQDTIVKGLEVVDVVKFDTTKINNNQEQINLDYLVTSFDDGLYYIPPFPIIYQADTFYSNALSLKVMTIPVDTVAKNFYDIKSVMQPKFVFADYLYILIIIWVVLVILAVILYFVVFKKKKKKMPFKKTIVLPPHIRALNALEGVKRENMWQQGRYKEYYTQLTDILRIYLFERFGVNAMEMTSDEILLSVQAYHEAQSAYENLQQVLKLADLVKFAKLTPLPNENELSYMNSTLFVSQTQPEEKPEKEEKDKQK